MPPDLERYGKVLERVPPRAKLEVPRQEIPKVLAVLLDRYSIDDVGSTGTPAGRRDRGIIRAVAAFIEQLENDPCQFIMASVCRTEATELI